MVNRTPIEMCGNAKKLPAGVLAYLRQQGAQGGTIGGTLVWLVVFVGVVTLVPLVCYPAGRTGPFRVRVVDERTGAGVPAARVTVENGAVGATAFDGSVLFWLDTALMKRTVQSTIEQRGVTTTVELPVRSGGWVSVPVAAP